MPRIAGINIPEQEKIDLSLTRIYGIGPGNVLTILEKAGVSPQKRAHDLNGEEIASINQVLSGLKIEGDLRGEVNANIERLKRIGCYRGRRHLANLPVRGQRTRSNARTKRGKRMTIGALKKEALAKIEGAAKEGKESESKANKSK
ncbi:30S ribosomal protein S13 [Candidatus Shapirobacteria bacterium]|nr:30S ribosomal protein S13 [Candidatus Shapirobacteria bacterium]